MATMYCALCNRPVEARRQIGVGTVVLAFFTAGLSLLAIPFYDVRCSICRGTAVYPTPQAAASSGVSIPTDRLEALERRVGLMEEELESAGVELRRLKAERDFYSQLLEDPTRSSAAPAPRGERGDR